MIKTYAQILAESGIPDADANAKPNGLIDPTKGDNEVTNDPKYNAVASGGAIADDSFDAEMTDKVVKMIEGSVLTALMTGNSISSDLNESVSASYDIPMSFDPVFECASILTDGIIIPIIEGADADRVSSAVTMFYDLAETASNEGEKETSIAIARLSEMAIESFEKLGCEAGDSIMESHMVLTEKVGLGARSLIKRIFTGVDNDVENKVMDMIEKIKTPKQKRDALNSLRKAKERAQTVNGTKEFSRGTFLQDWKHALTNQPTIFMLMNKYSGNIDEFIKTLDKCIQAVEAVEVTEIGS